MRVHPASGRRLTACILDTSAALHTLPIHGRSAQTRPRLKTTTLSSRSAIRAHTPAWQTVRSAAVSMPSADTAAMETSDPKTIVLLTTLGCGFCRKAKAALKEAGFAYKEIEASQQLSLLRKAKEVTGQQTVPQIFLDGKLLGGATEVLEMIKDGELKQKVDSATQPALPPALQQAVQESSSSSQSLERVVLPEGMSLETYQDLKALAAKLQKQQLGTTHREWLRSYPATFRPEKALAWLQNQSEATSESAAQDLLTQLLRAHLVDVVVESEGKPKYLRLVADAESPQKGQALNGVISWYGPARPANEVAEGLRRLILGLYEKHLSEDGKAISYSGLASDPTFQLFVTATAELQKVDPTPLQREERIAFFLNIYNALIVHAQAVFGGPDNLLSRVRWFSSIKYNIGGYDYSADDIEHGILRANRPAASALPVLLGHPEWSGGHFKQNDPRLKQGLREVDRRIHFALNCGAKSCPPIKVYTAESLEDGLQSAAAAFCEGEVMVDVPKRTVKMSKIFEWYKQDFGSKQETLEWLLGYLPTQAAEDLRQLLDSQAGGSDAIEVVYKEYDWGLNSK